MPVLTNTNAPQQPTGYVDPYEAQRAALQARMQQEPAPMFSPEEAAQRVAQNKREYQLGLLAQMSGDEALSPVGGLVLKNALANRQQRVSERGTADPLTGKFTYSPDFLRAQQQAQLDAIDTKTAAGRSAYEKERRDFADRQELARQRAEEMRTLKSMGGGNEPLVQIVDPESGEVTYVRRSDAVGKKAPPKGGGGNTSEGERNAAGFAGMMLLSNQGLDKFEDLGTKNTAMQAVLAVPMIGDTAARRLMTPEQQQYDQAARQWVRAKLRKESGASIAPDEMDGEIKTFFPQPGEGLEVRAQKRVARELATRAMVAAAGRAEVVRPLDPNAPAGPPSVDVGAALKNRSPGAQPKTSENKVRESNW